MLFAGRRSRSVKRDDRTTAAASEVVEDRASCLYCTDLYVNSTESWIQCQECLEWAHVGCAGVTKHDEHFVCEHCDSD